jgi:hypothetical protein
MTSYDVASTIHQSLSLGTERTTAPGAASTAKSPAKAPRGKKAGTPASVLDGPTNEALELGSHGSKLAHLAGVH